MAASRSCCAKRPQTPSHPHLRVPTPQTPFITLLGGVNGRGAGEAEGPGRGRKPQPATLSTFDWALTLEQEREKEAVGAGR